MANFDSLRILITGACGVTSRSVVRSLRMSQEFSQSVLIGTDTCENTYGLYEGLYAKIYKVSHTNQDSYQQEMESIIQQEQIDVAIIIPELEVLTWARISFPVRYVVPPLAFCEQSINKAILYKNLEGSGLIPTYDIVSRELLLAGNTGALQDQYPMWIRDFSSGSTSGKGALKVHHADELKAWVVLNPMIDQFMLTAFLGGGNYACHLLYHHGELKKVACYERLVYFMGRVAPSGVTGNIAKGRLLNHPALVDAAKKAIDKICSDQNVIMNGIVAVDMKANDDGQPFITEINIRHVAATSAFASAGFNLAAYQLLLALDREDLLSPELEKEFPKDNLLLRDIDGTPRWVASHRELNLGESI